jgi:hypothetical protein
MTQYLKRSATILLAIAGFAFVSCSPGIDMPKGTSKGFTSARMVKRDPNRPPSTEAIEVQVHRMIQKSLANRFEANGIAFGKNDADLTVAYLVIYQEPGMTARYEDYFGYGRDADKISDVAHIRGALDNKRADYFQRAGILVDVIDSRTNKLVFRNLATGDVVRGTSDSNRAARIDAAIAEALASFFR